MRVPRDAAKFGWGIESLKKLIQEHLAAYEAERREMEFMPFQQWIMLHNVAVTSGGIFENALTPKTSFRAHVARVVCAARAGWFSLLLPLPCCSRSHPS